MNHQRLAFLFLLFLILGAMSVQFVSAEQPWDTINDIITLKFLTKLGFQSTADPIEGIVRFLLFITLFVILFKVAEKLLPLGRGAAFIIAFVISLISCIFIPGSLLVAAFSSYSLIISLLLLAIPLGLLIFAYFSLKEHHWLRFVVMGLVVVLLVSIYLYTTDTSTGLAAGATKDFGRVLSSMSPWFIVLIIIASIACFFSLVQALGSIGGATEHQPNWFGKFKNKALARFPSTEKGKELRHARREETRLLSTLAAEKEELIKLENAEAKGEAYSRVSEEIFVGKEVQSSAHAETWNDSFKRLDSSFEEVVKSQKTWKRAERREVREMKRLIDELAKRGASDKDREELEAKEKHLLDQYSIISGSVESAKNSLAAIKDVHNSVHERINSIYLAYYEKFIKGSRSKSKKVDPKIIIVPSNVPGKETEPKKLIEAYNKEGDTPPYVLKLDITARRLDLMKQELEKFMTYISSARELEAKIVKATAAFADEVKKKWIL